MAEQPRRRPTEAEVRETVTRIVNGMASLTGTQPADHSPATAPGAAPAPAATAGVGPGARAAIAIGGDHGGLALKQEIGTLLASQGYDVRDCGTHSSDAVDYPDIAHAVATLVGDGTCAWGIVVDGAGIGSCMVANKVPGVRAALAYDLSSARNSREHNHANVLTLGARLVGTGLALDIVALWLATPWGPGRHAARVDKITEVERRYLRSGSGDGTR